MKSILTIFFILHSIASFSQDIKVINQKLNTAFSKIHYWEFYNTDDDKISPEDSLENANDNFEKLLLKYTSANLQTLHFDFKNLVDSGLIIATSEDSLFRIYSWNTETGGTMHFFRNVCQYKNGDRIFSKTININNDDDGDPGCFYYQINDIVSNNTKYYIAQNESHLGSGMFSFYVQIFSISNFQLNDSTAELIKTKTGLTNQLGYELDLTASVNRDRDIPDYTIKYDKENKTISIPVVLDNEEITKNRIVYRFNGQYFEKQ